MIARLLDENNFHRSRQASDSNKETAGRLGVSVKTIEAHRANIMPEAATPIGERFGALRDPQQDRPGISAPPMSGGRVAAFVDRSACCT